MTYSVGPYKTRKQAEATAKELRKRRFIGKKRFPLTHGKKHFKKVEVIKRKSRFGNYVVIATHPNYYYYN